jgi:hypothetical protein
MNLRTLILIGLVLGMSACSKQEPVTPEPADEVADEMADEAAAAMAIDWRNEALIEHMHRHADYVDDLNSALEMGDLAAARTPAYWLSQHETVDGLPPELQPYAEGMREAAAEVGAADNLESARLAAEAIDAQCQGCHEAAGFTRN